MSYVAINVLTVPEGAGSTLEGRFAARQGAVDSAPGFEHFELLRPLEGTSDYLVYTRWASEQHFQDWRSSQAFGQGHAQASGRPDGAAPAASGSTVWAFEVVQQSDGAAGGAHSSSDGAGSAGSAGTADTVGTADTAHEAVPAIVTTDPGAQQAEGQGDDTPSQAAGEPGFA